MLRADASLNDEIDTLCNKIDVHDNSLRYENLSREDQIFLLSLFLESLTSSEYRYCLLDADENGELADYLMAILRNPDDSESIVSFKDKALDILIKYYASEFNRRIEANLQDRVNNSKSYYDAYEDFMEGYLESYAGSAL